MLIMYFLGSFSRQFGKGQDRFITYQTDDYQVIGVFDGHGDTASAADFMQRNFKIFADQFDFSLPTALTDFHSGIITLDKTYNKHFKDRSGCTISVVFLLPSSTLCFNLGDSRAMTSSEQTRKPTLLCPPHCTSQASELTRIKLNGGTVENGRFFPDETHDTWSFMVTRSFGNGFAKGRSMTAVGDFGAVSEVEYSALKRGGRILKSEVHFDWVLVYSDGLEVLREAEICLGVNENLEKYRLSKNSEFLNPHAICQKLVQKAHERVRSYSYIDDISCCLAIRKSLIEKFVHPTKMRQQKSSFHRILAPVPFDVYFSQFGSRLRSSYNKYARLSKGEELLYGRGQGDMCQYYCCLDDHQRSSVDAKFTKAEELVLKEFYRGGK